MSLGLWVIRVVVGALIAAHGTQKLWGWFGGHGPQGTGAFFESIGLRPGRTMALMAGGTEVAAGLMLGSGLLTPIAAALLSAVMLTAIFTAHRGTGLWVTDGGTEYNLVLLACAFGVTCTGPGQWSLDNAFGIDLAGEGWALAALGTGLVATLLTLVYVRRPLASASHHATQP